MMFLFGETLKKTTESVGRFDCPCCAEENEFQGILEKSYFCIFFIPLLPMNTVANYWQCTACQEVFEPNNLDRPVYCLTMLAVFSYLLSGYGLHENLNSALKIYENLSNTKIDESEILGYKESYNSIEDLTSVLKKLSFHMDYSGRIKVVKAAYLFTYGACEMEFNDRVRVNLIGSALNIDIGTINAMV